ncbi:MAG: hypothetical protein P8Z37_04770, partial [Acidobacteriota bacterium]
GAPRRVIRSQAKRLRAPLLEIDACRIALRGERQGHCMIDLETPVRKYCNLKLPLAGTYQAENTALAVAAIELLEAFPVKVSDIRRGLAGVRWAGRLDEYASKRKTLLDGAHNPDAAQRLRDYLLERKETEIHLVFGAVRDKNIREVAASLFPLAETIQLTPLTNTRSALPEDIAAMTPRFRTRISAHSDMRKALNAAWNLCSPQGLVVVTGSLYLVGELLPVVRRYTEPNPVKGRTLRTSSTLSYKTASQ